MLFLEQKTLLPVERNHNKWAGFVRNLPRCSGSSTGNIIFPTKANCALYASQFDKTFLKLQQIVNYFTYKAVRTVLSQLYELNPTQYRWFYDFLVKNKPGDAKSFLRMLTKEKQDLAERVMVTRLHLYGKWIKKCNHAEMYEEISNQNLELMRERLMETVKWPSDDTNSEKIG
ncbi:hypothetical protein GIB67_018176 [Kingdonia uniflora]|uniref:Chaperonin-like RbcX protein n=1 Tax=Kingdonia uniflora TaxID=39325 RepID=A0A7J7NMH5_9MAGN|nr:hypothetical protein GIB67_018176 [Kingdonia uniflora]